MNEFFGVEEILERGRRSSGRRRFIRIRRRISTPGVGRYMPVG